MASMNDLVVSPCSNPDKDMDWTLAAYSKIGFDQFEVFTSWAKSAVDLSADPAVYLEMAAQHNMRFTSFHLPPVGDDMDESLNRAITGARFAKALGADVMLFKATDRANYIKSAGAFLDAVDALGVTPVLQNHAGSPISTLDDFREVIDGIADARMKTLLEVGQFHSEGVLWQQGYDLLGDSIALVHIKDQIHSQSVPFGTGQIDLPGLFKHMDSVGYTGRYVVEMEVTDSENTLDYLAAAREYIRTNCLEDADV